MASKRPLYHPATQGSDIGKKKTRKPLVQGRLVADGSERKSALSLRQGVLNDDVTDPTLTPMKSVPVVTERTSPRPEPPSRCLDLSDADLDLSMTSEHQRSVMVIDASHLGNSPNSTEVDVIVAYEDSPARVVCHTPKQLERSFHSAASSDRGQDVPHWTVRAERVPKMATPSINTSKTLFRSPDGDAESETKSTNQGSYISHKSRGIIQEILAQELGPDHIDSVSLQTSPESPQHEMSQNTKSDNPQTNVSRNSRDKPGQAPSSKTKSSFPKSSSPLDLQQVSSNNRKVSNRSVSNYPQPKFDEDSDTSTEKFPVKDSSLPAHYSVKFSAGTENNSDDACSLYEYVTPKKANTAAEKPKSAVKVKEETTQKAPSAVIKKKPGRIVQSRYLQSKNTSSNKSNHNSSSKNSDTEPTVLSSNSQPISSSVKSQVKKDSISKSRPQFKPSFAQKQTGSGPREPTLRRATTTARLEQSNRTNRTQSKVHGSSKSISTDHFESPHTLVRAVDYSDSDRESPVRKTSTPTHDQLANLSHSINASAIHSVSALSVSTASKSHPSLGTETLYTQKQSAQSTASQQKTAAANKLDLELQHARYTQTLFLLSKVRKMFMDQEQSAMTQLHSLWKLVEEKRQEAAQLQMDVARLKRINLEDALMDQIEEDLQSLVGSLPQVEKDYSTLSTALDSMRHQLATSDIYYPREEDKEAYEEALTLALLETEDLYRKLLSMIGDHVVPVGQYLSGLEAIDQNLQASMGGLHSCQRDMNSIQDLTTRLVSLVVQTMQQ